MLRPIERFEGRDKNPLYTITIKKNGRIYEGRVEDTLVFKDINKRKLLKILDEWCKEQLKKIKEA